MMPNDFLDTIRNVQQSYQRIQKEPPLRDKIIGAVRKHYPLHKTTLWPLDYFIRDDMYYVLIEDSSGVKTYATVTRMEVEDHNNYLPCGEIHVTQEPLFSIERYRPK